MCVCVCVCHEHVSFGIVEFTIDERLEFTRSATLARNKLPLFFLSFFQKVPHLSLRFAVLLSLTEKAGIIRAFSLKANRVTLLHGTNILFINRTPIVTGLYKTNKTLQSLCCRVLFVIVESCFEESCREILFFFFLKMFFKRQKRSKTGRENRIHTKA